jgi:hypothetical protein
MANYNRQFTEACHNGYIDIAKRLAHDHHLDVHSYICNTIGMCKWTYIYRKMANTRPPSR